MHIFKFVVMNNKKGGLSLFKFSKFGKIGIALVLVLMTVLSTFSMVWATATFPSNGDSLSQGGSFTFYFPNKYNEASPNTTTLDKSISYDYRIDAASNSWSYVKGRGAYSSVYSEGVDNTRHNSNGSHTAGQSIIGGVPGRQYSPADYTGGGNNYNFEYGPWYKKRQNDSYVGDWIWAPSTYAAQGVVVPGFHSSGTENSVFGKNLDENGQIKAFDNVAQCVVQPADADPDNPTYKDWDLYGVDNERVISRVFYYFTPRMYKTDNTLFDYQTTTRPSLISEDENGEPLEIRSIGSGYQLSPTQIKNYKDVIFAWCQQWYQEYTASNGQKKHAFLGSANDADLGRDRYAYILEECDTSDSYKGRLTTPDGNIHFHVLGKEVDGEYIVTYEDVFYFMAWCAYLTNDIVDDSPNGLAALNALNTNSTSDWGNVHDTSSTVTINLPTAHAKDTSLDFDPGTYSHFYETTMTRDRFNRNVIYCLEHGYLSASLVQDNRYGWGWAFLAAQNDGYKEWYYPDSQDGRYGIIKGDTSDYDWFRQNMGESSGTSNPNNAWSSVWGNVTYQLGVHNRTRANWALATQELLKLTFEGSCYEDGLRNYHRPETGNMTRKTGEGDVTYRQYFYKDYQLTPGNTATSRMPYVPPEVSCFYFYPSHPSTKPNPSANMYQVYMSSAIVRMPVCIYKYPSTIQSDGTDLRSDDDHTDYYGNLSDVRFKVYSNSACTNEVRVGNMNGEAWSNGSVVSENCWEVITPDRYIDKQTGAIQLDSDWKAGLYFSQPNKTYYIKEVSTGNDYYNADLRVITTGTNATSGSFVDGSVKTTRDGVVEFALDSQATSTNNNLSLSDTPKLGSFSITKKSTKKNGNNDVKIANAQFKLYRAHDFFEAANNAVSVSAFNLTPVATLTTNSQGEAQLDNLPFGHYVIAETYVNSTYDIKSSNIALDDVIQAAKDAGSFNDFVNYSNTALSPKDYEINITSGNSSASSPYHRDFTNTPYGKVTLKKVNESNQPLSGAEFKIYGSIAGSGIVAKDKNNQPLVGTTGSDGTLTFNNVPFGNYYLVETKAPTGYVIDSKYTISYLRTAGSNCVLNYNTRTVSGVYTVDFPQIVNRVSEHGLVLKKQLSSSADEYVALPEAVQAMIQKDGIDELYDLNGVSFTFYTNSSCTTVLNNCISINGDTTKHTARNVKLTANGDLNLRLPDDGTSKTYYYKETFSSTTKLKPMGNNTANTVFSVTVPSGSASAVVTHNNYVPLASIPFSKVDSITNNIITKAQSDIADAAVFKFEYFANTSYNQASDIPQNATADIVYYMQSCSGQYVHTIASAGGIVAGDAWATARGLDHTSYQDVPPSKLPAGSVRITEVAPAAGYTLNSNTYFVKITGNTSDNLTDWGDGVKNGRAAIYDDPYVAIRFEKSDAATGAAVPNAVYRLDYFKNHYASESQTPETGDYVFYLKTDSDGRWNTFTASCYDSRTSVTAMGDSHDISPNDDSFYHGGFKMGSTYRVRECEAPDGYALSDNVFWGHFGDGDTLQEYITDVDIPLISIEGTKFMHDQDNADGSRPSAMGVILYRGSTKVDVRIFNRPVNPDDTAASGYDGGIIAPDHRLYSALTFWNLAESSPYWNYKFEDLPMGYLDDNDNFVYYEYSVKEAFYANVEPKRNAHGYAGTYYLAPYWWDSYPNDIQFANSGRGYAQDYDTLYCNTRAQAETSAGTVYNQAVGNIATKQATGTVNGNNVTWTVSDIRDGTRQFFVNIINTHEPDTSSVTVQKKWVDDDNLSNRPSTIQVELYRSFDVSPFVIDGSLDDNFDGIVHEYLDTYTLSASNNWSLTIPDLTDYASVADGHTPMNDIPRGYYDETLYENNDTYGYDAPKYNYYIREVPIGDNYMVEQTSSKVVTNYELKDIVIEKQWDDNSDSAGKRPSSVTFTLYREYTVPGYYASDSQPTTITKTVGTYTIDTFNNNTGSVRVTGQPLIAASIFGDNPVDDLGNRIGINPDDTAHSTFTKYDTTGEYAIPCRYYVTESAVTAYDAPEYLTHTEAVVQGVLTETIPVKNTLKLFDVVINKYLRTGEPGNGNTLEARLQGTTRAKNGTFVLGKGNGNGGVLYSTALSSGIYEAQDFELLGTANETRNYFRVRGGTVSNRSYISSKFPSSPLDENGENYNTFSSRYYMSVGNKNATVQGQLRIKNLEPGEYVLLEIIPPTGNYSTAYKPFAFTLLDDGRIRYSTGGATYFMDEINVIDDKIYVPKTGAEGYMLYYITATLLVLSLSVFGVLFFRRRRIRSSIVK